MFDNITLHRDGRKFFDKTIESTIKHAIPITFTNPRLLLKCLRIFKYQKKAMKLRNRLENTGILVPAVIIFSLTSHCNLKCLGCYMREQNRAIANEMNKDQIDSIISQAVKLGVSIIVFAGGEPLLLVDEIAKFAFSYPDILFAVFTNGLLIDKKTALILTKNKNIVPIISFEGSRTETDLRRGTGVYDHLLTTCRLLSKHNIFFGCSVTVSNKNFESVTDESFIKDMLDAKFRVFIFVEYVPVKHGTEGLVLSSDQRSSLKLTLIRYTTQFPALFIGFPGNEEAFGGCLASGRGFLHISPSGDLEPCPAAPFSDVNLTKISLKEALKSGFLKEIRENHNKLSEAEGGCALWSNREWVFTVLTRYSENNCYPED